MDLHRCTGIFHQTWRINSRCVSVCMCVCVCVQCALCGWQHVWVLDVSEWERLSQSMYPKSETAVDVKTLRTHTMSCTGYIRSVRSSHSPPTTRVTLAHSTDQCSKAVAPWRVKFLGTQSNISVCHAHTSLHSTKPCMYCTSSLLHYW